MDKHYVFYFGYIPQRYILHSKFICDLFLKSQKDPTYGFDNLAHPDVTVFHSLKPKVVKTFMNSQQVMLSQPGRSMFVFSRKTKQVFM